MAMAALAPPPQQQTPSSALVMEISVVSMEGLNHYTSYFNPTIRPFITITPTPTHHVDTRDHHKFRVAVDPITFFSDRYSNSCLHLQLFTKRRIVGPAQLGWCLIPASDIAAALFPPASVRYLSYRLRARDGSRGHAIINISIKFEQGNAPNLDTCRTVIGTPVTAIRGAGNADYSIPNTIVNTPIMR